MVAAPSPPTGTRSPPPPLLLLIQILALLFIAGVESVPATSSSAAAAFLPGAANKVVGRARPAPLVASRACMAMSANPNDMETPEERARRMELVRKLQDQFYRDETGVVVGGAKSDIEDGSGGGESTDGGTLLNVPLWRVQWTELPHYQNVLHVHVPHYTHMFNRVLASPRPWYFGHLYLPGGSDNLDNPEYRLGAPDSKAATIGTLMEVSDVERLDDGRLVMIVRALDRFKVLEATQHAPYAVATVQVLNDEDRDGEGSSAAAMAESVRWRPFEFRDVTVAEGEAGGGISPLANFDGDKAVSASPNASPPPAGNEDDVVLDLEYDIWVATDMMIRLLAEIMSSQGQRAPVPTQILGLLPKDPVRPWPSNFAFEGYADKLQRENAMIGTATKTPFVRADTAAPFYPSRRRARRLGYVIWMLLDSLVVGNQGAALTRQEILEMEGTVKRLEAAGAQLRGINSMLRMVLDQSKK